MKEQEIKLKTNDGYLDCRVFITNKIDNPPIIFYMDAPAIRDELRYMCRKISQRGYNVILPNLFYRVGTEGNYPFDQTRYKDNNVELGKMVSTMNNTKNQMIAEDTRVILNYISKIFSKKSKVGIVGYCMSGRFVVYCGAKFPNNIAAIASFYGVDIVTNNFDSPHLLASKIKGELYMGFAEKDSWVPSKTLEKIKLAFPNKKNKVLLEKYPGTKHGFAFPSRSTYVKKADEKHWSRLFELFERNLKT